MEQAMEQDGQPVTVPCPYCGRQVDEENIEPPADYCHHE